MASLRKQGNRRRFIEHTARDGPRHSGSVGCYQFVRCAVLYIFGAGSLIWMNIARVYVPNWCSYIGLQEGVE
jgi:hypothetical protein